jgi:hypothetical protein
MKWSFALTEAGEIHIVDGELPEAENVVVLDIQNRGGGLHIIDAGQAAALRKLLGTPSIREVVRHVGPDAADELERLLDAITQIVERRAAELRGDEPAP